MSSPDSPSLTSSSPSSSSLLPPPRTTYQHPQRGHLRVDYGPSLPTSTISFFKHISVPIEEQHIKDTLEEKEKKSENDKEDENTSSSSSIQSSSSPPDSSSFIYSAALSECLPHVYRCFVHKLISPSLRLAVLHCPLAELLSLVDIIIDKKYFVPLSCDRYGSYVIQRILRRLQKEGERVKALVEEEERKKKKEEKKKRKKLEKEKKKEEERDDNEQRKKRRKKKKESEESSVKKENDDDNDNDNKMKDENDNDNDNDNEKVKQINTNNDEDDDDDDPLARVSSSSASSSSPLSPSLLYNRIHTFFASLFSALSHPQPPPPTYTEKMRSYIGWVWMMMNSNASFVLRDLIEVLRGRKMGEEREVGREGNVSSKEELEEERKENEKKKKLSNRKKWEKNSHLDVNTNKLTDGAKSDKNHIPTSLSSSPLLSFGLEFHLTLLPFLEYLSSCPHADLIDYIYSPSSSAALQHLIDMGGDKELGEEVKKGIVNVLGRIISEGKGEEENNTKKKSEKTEDKDKDVKMKKEDDDGSDSESESGSESDSSSSSSSSSSFSPKSSSSLPRPLLSTMLCDPIASHFVESLLSSPFLSSPSSLESFYSAHLTSHLQMLTSHPIANHVIQTFLGMLVPTKNANLNNANGNDNQNVHSETNDSSSSSPSSPTIFLPLLTTIMKEFRTHTLFNFHSENRLAVLVKFIDSYRRNRGTLKEALPFVLESISQKGEKEKIPTGKNIISTLIYLPNPNLSSTSSSLTSTNTFSYFGSLLLQSLLSFLKDDISILHTPLMEYFTSLPPSSLLAFCCSNVVSHVVETFFKLTHSRYDKLKRQLIHLIFDSKTTPSPTLTLCTNPCGAFVFQSAVSAAQFKLQQELIGNFVKEMDVIKGTKWGTILIHEENIILFNRDKTVDKNQWQAWRKQKIKEKALQKIQNLSFNA